MFGFNSLFEMQERSEVFSDKFPDAGFNSLFEMHRANRPDHPFWRNRVSILYVEMHG